MKGYGRGLAMSDEVGVRPILLGGTVGGLSDGVKVKGKETYGLIRLGVRAVPNASYKKASI